MTDPEAKIRAAIASLLQRLRVPSVPAWTDQAVAEILHAAGMAAGDVLGPDGSPAGTVQEAQSAALSSMAMLSAGKAAEFGGVAREMLAAFTKQPNGWNARVKQAQIDEWRDRLGGQE